MSDKLKLSNTPDQPENEGINNLDAGLQDGMLTYYNSIAPVIKRIEKEPFDFVDFFSHRPKPRG